MKSLENKDTRRQLFRTIAAVAASVPFLALEKKSVRAWGWNPGRHNGWDGDRGWDGDGHGDGGRDGGGGGSAGGGGCCCLLKGTKISTPLGERAVEDLQVGEEVNTLSGRSTIKWIGYNRFTKDEGRPWVDSVMPIRIARFAIDDCSPHHDLYLSPEHCVFLNGVLIPVKHLVNHSSIAPATPSGMATIEYYHIEFDTHEVVLAEGALVESFLNEAWQRENFSNFAAYERLYRDERRSAMTPFAPVVGYRNRREKATGLARSLISNVVDVRDPIQIAYDHLARRAEAMAA
jgi:Hint domain